MNSHRRNEYCLFLLVVANVSYISQSDALLTAPALLSNRFTTSASFISNSRLDNKYSPLAATTTSGNDQQRIDTYNISSEVALQTFVKRSKEEDSHRVQQEAPKYQPNRVEEGDFAFKPSNGVSAPSVSNESVMPSARGESSSRPSTNTSAYSINHKSIKISLHKEQRARRIPQPIQPTPLGKWEYIKGNFVLRPSAFNNDPTESQPKALLHFIGGALVGAAPQITYRYLLERLAKENYLIVTTPYRLSFNHLQSCDEVIEKFERIAPSLAQQYGAIPVIGVGHSLGGVLQVLITSL